MQISNTTSNRVNVYFSNIYKCLFSFRIFGVLCVPLCNPSLYLIVVDLNCGLKLPKVNVFFLFPPHLLSLFLLLSSYKIRFNTIRFDFQNTLILKIFVMWKSKQPPTKKNRNQDMKCIWLLTFIRSIYVYIMCVYISNTTTTTTTIYSVPYTYIRTYLYSTISYVNLVWFHISIGVCNYDWKIELCS